MEKAKIAAGLKGMHTRKQLREGNAEKFADPTHGAKLRKKQLKKIARAFEDLREQWIAEQSPATGAFRMYTQNAADTLSSALRRAPPPLRTVCFSPVSCCFSLAPLHLSLRQNKQTETEAPSPAISNLVDLISFRSGCSCVHLIGRL